MSNNGRDIKVVLFSGGMDSYCLVKTVKPDIILFFDIGTKDNKKEKELLKTLPFYNKITIVKLNLKQWELKNKILPHRNSIFCLIASNYGNRIYIGTTKGDTTKDKDYIFKAQVEGMLNYFALDKHKVNLPNYPYSIEMPFKDITKTEIIKYFIREGNNINELITYSRSCYDGKDKECGICRSCIRKAIALELNNYNTDKCFSNKPFENINEETMNKFKERKEEFEELQKVIKSKHLYSRTML
jgi:7-cyano-7-deazaguanine synthase